LAAAAQQFCSAAESGAATQSLRILTEVAADECTRLRTQLPAVLALNIGLLRCQGAPTLTRLACVRNLSRVLKCPTRLPELFAAYDCSPDAPAEVLPALEALLWAASQDQDKMRKQALTALVAIARAIVGGIRESSASLSGPSSDDAKGDHWSAAWTERQAQEAELRVDIAAFHRSAEAWLSARCEHGATPSEVAKFLSTHRGAIDAAKVGDFLGRHEDIMTEFIHQCDLKGLSIVPAFTRVLSSVQMPGEAQQVDRFCERFGSIWGEANGVDRESAYIFAFSLVMLSTDLHRPADPKHVQMSFEQFSRNLLGALTGAPLPERMLREAYDQLRTGALFVRDDAELGPAQLCARLQHALCRPAATQSSVGQRVSGLADLPGLWRTVWSAAWRPLLGAFTNGAAHQGGEKDEENLEVALRGLQLGCQAAALLGEAVQAEAFSTALRNLSPS
jgi:hypothetical protein